MNKFKALTIFVFLLLSRHAAMASVHTAIGGNFSVASTWADGIVPSCAGGETVLVAQGASLVGDVSCILGSKTSAVGPAIHLTPNSSFSPLQNITFTLRAYDHSTNVVAVIDLGARFVPSPGSTILSDCAVDGSCVIVNHGLLQSTNVNWSVPASNVSWNNREPYTATHLGLLDKYGLPNVWVAQLNRPWISNLEGTGLGSAGDSSIMFSKQGQGALQVEVSSLAQVTSPGTYYLNYDAGVVYWYQTVGAGFKAEYKYLTFVGGIIVSTNNAVGNQAIFDHSTFSYMGTLGVTNAYVITAAYKQSSSVGANRLLQVTNNTFRYCKRVVGLTGPVTGTASDPVLLKGNTIYAVAGDAWGTAFTDSLTNSSYVAVQNNIVPDGVWGGAFLTTKVYGTPTVLTGWTIVGNIVRVANFEFDIPRATTWPDSVISGNFVMGFSGAFDGREIAGFGGTLGHPTIISRNVFVHPHRVLNVASYQQFSDNYTADFDHHGVNGPAMVFDSFVNSVQLLRNISVNGGDGPTFQLGYVTHVWMDDITIAQNTSIHKTQGSLEFGDQGDGYGSALLSNLNIYNNLFPFSALGVVRRPDTPTVNSRVHLYRADWNDFYGDTITYKGLNTFSTFTWNGGEYDTSPVRNVTGVTLGDTSYGSPQSGLSLAWTYSGPMNVKLSWNGGSPTQLVGYSGNVNSAANLAFVGLASLYAGTLTDGSQNFPRAQNDPATPIGMWVKITGGTGSGQIRRVTSATAQMLTAVPAWTVVPDTSSTYVLYYSEVKLLDARRTNYVLAGIDLRSTPNTSATDVGIGLKFNTVNADPRFVNSNASWRTWDRTQGGTGAEDSIFSRLSANPALVLSLGTWEKMQFAPTNNLLNYGLNNQYIGASPVSGVGP